MGGCLISFNGEVLIQNYLSNYALIVGGAYPGNIGVDILFGILGEGIDIAVLQLGSGYQGGDVVTDGVDDIISIGVSVVVIVNGGIVANIEVDNASVVKGKLNLILGILQTLDGQILGILLNEGNCGEGCEGEHHGTELGSIIVEELCFGLDIVS